MLVIYYMGETIGSIEDFLSQYTSKNTIRIYYATYKDYFKFIYPKLRTLPKEKLDKELIEYSIQYTPKEGWGGILKCPHCGHEFRVPSLDGWLE